MSNLGWLFERIWDVRAILDILVVTFII